MIPIHLQIGGGRWRHIDGGLDLSKKRLGEFTYSLLHTGAHLGQLWAFNPKYHRSMVLAAVYLTPGQEENMVQDCPWLKFIDPPEVHLN